MTWLKKHWFDVLLILAIAAATLYSFRSGGPVAESPSDVVILRLDGDVEYAVADFIAGGIRDAERRGAEAVLIEIATFGGRIDAMTDIGEAISTARIPVHTFVRGKALSAGAYIALSGKKLVMNPESVMGASEPRTMDNKKVEDEKVLASMRGLFRAVAEARKARGVNLDPTIAEGMVDASVELATEGIKKPGQLVVLTGSEAQELGYCDGLASTREQALGILGLEGRALRVVSPSPAQSLARVLTNPVISILLIVLGTLGILIEVASPGFGVPGVVGILSFASFFGARVLANMAGWEVVALFILGLGLLILEALAPGFGILGISGIVALGGSIILAYPARTVGAWSLLIAGLWLVFLGRLAFRALGVTGPHGIVLQASQAREEGYVAVQSKVDLVGREGITLTVLRPAGAVQIDDRRIDVVSEGDYIPAGTPVRVVQVEGNRVVVRPKGP